ncbi:MAG: hypothetical protein COS19_04760 [Flavobacteriaceae bacterium CG02_land_8_20_14_3_00_34_13]|nr:MAG: hypothetical protein COS19_04760 [Flavobacteriaceae bacterium CG02_land_8_20_14_3_00_34_13]
MKLPFSLLSSLIFMVLLSCNQQNPKEKLAHLNGYWEISKVEMPDGTVKEYTISTLVDYIEIKDSVGFRKKVAPKLDGGFIINDDAEKITVKIENNTLNLYYSTQFDSWKETVLEANEQQLVVLNKDDKKYTYKKFEKFNLE